MRLMYPTIRPDIDARCRNERCHYVAYTPDGYCCGTCANAAIVGEYNYRLHSERGCKRERLPGGEGGIEWGPSVPGPSTLKGCLALVAILIVLALVFGLGSAWIGSTLQ